LYFEESSRFDAVPVVDQNAPSQQLFHDLFHLFYHLVPVSAVFEIGVMVPEDDIHVGDVLDLAISVYEILLK